MSGNQYITWNHWHEISQAFIIIDVRLLKIRLVGAPLARQDGDHQVALLGVVGARVALIAAFCIVIVPMGLRSGQLLHNGHLTGLWQCGHVFRHR